MDKYVFCVFFLKVAFIEGKWLVDKDNITLWLSYFASAIALANSQHKKGSNHHANLPLEMYSFTL